MDTTTTTTSTSTISVTSTEKNITDDAAATNNTLPSSTLITTVLTNVTETTSSYLSNVTDFTETTTPNNLNATDFTESIPNSTVSNSSIVSSEGLSVNELTNTTGNLSLGIVQFKAGANDTEIRDITSKLQTSTPFTYTERSDDVTIVIGIIVPLVLVAIMFGICVCYQKYWKPRSFKKRRKERGKVSFNDNPVVTGDVIKSPRYSDSEECNKNVFAELPDKQDGFVTIDLSDNHKEENGGINIMVPSTKADNNISNQNLESICEKDELYMSDDEHHGRNRAESVEVKESVVKHYNDIDKVTDNGSVVCSESNLVSDSSSINSKSDKNDQHVNDDDIEKESSIEQLNSIGETEEQSLKSEQNCVDIEKDASIEESISIGETGEQPPKNEQNDNDSDTSLSEENTKF
ncbi:uncharacterized protein LOC134682044 [Mytilus trossulus]|uniref:uncharacterized protein LOC134682044 n=1 Tax=Mytilus trossulus TaxID=6551 RepID=UPI003006F101